MPEEKLKDIEKIANELSIDINNPSSIKDVNKEIAKSMRQDEETRIIEFNRRLKTMRCPLGHRGARPIYSSHTTIGPEYGPSGYECIKCGTHYNPQ